MLIQVFWVMVRVVGAMLSVVLGAGMTLGLFFFMQFLISTGDQVDRRVEPIRLVDATMPKIELELIEEIDRPEPIQLVANLPDSEQKRVSLDVNPHLYVERSVVEIESELDLPMASITATDGDFLPLVAIAPRYPENARKRGIEGWCLISFTVDALGKVDKDTIEIVDAEPPAVFDRTSKQAAARFMFQPRVINGEGVEVPGVHYLFVYKDPNLRLDSG